MAADPQAVPGDMAALPTKATCPGCHAELDSTRLGGLCPSCFFAAAEDPVSGERKASETLQLPNLTLGPELARGGMGIIYAAEQVNPPRPVAVKILLPQWAEHAAIGERFRREARAMAALEHPAILPIYTVGETDGLPWFTMKLAKGGSLADRARTYRGDWKKSAALVARIARALAFAHERGVLHRDVKPGNLVFDANGEAYLADFGLAKHHDAPREQAILTLDAEVLGTPSYLAPELAGGRSRAATIASDIYSLGAVLYELLAGERPHKDNHLPTLLRRVADEAPYALATFLPRPPGDLAAICEKAMSREPEHRFVTARAMAEDLERFLRGEPVRARQAGAKELLWRWCRRHPAVAGLLGTVAVLLITLAVGSVIAALKISRAEKDAVMAREHAEANLRKSRLAEAEGARQGRLIRFREHALQLVAAAAHPAETEGFRAERRSEAIAALAFPALSQYALPDSPARGQTLAAMSDGIGHLAWHDSRRGAWVVTLAATGAVISQAEKSGRPVRVSTDGRWLAAAKPGAGWQLWSLEKKTAELRGEYPGYFEDFAASGTAFAFYHNSRRDRVLGEARSLPGNESLMQLEFPNVALKMRFSPDGSLCAVAPSSYVNNSPFPYTVRLHETRGGKVARELSAGLANCIWCMAWSDDGRMLAASERGGATLVWDTRTGNARHVFRGMGTSLWQLAFSPDGRQLAAISDDRLLTIFDMAGGSPIARGSAWLAEGTPAFTWSRVDPELFGPVSVDGANTLIRVHPGAFSSFRMEDSHGRAKGLREAPSGAALIVGDSRHARWCDAPSGRTKQTFAIGFWAAFAVSPDQRWLYGLGEPGLFRWALRPDGVDESSRAVLQAPAGYGALSLDRSGRRLAMATRDGVQLVSEPTGASPAKQPFVFPQARAVSISSDGQWLAACGEKGIAVWDITTGANVFTESGAASAIAFDPSDRFLIVAREQYAAYETASWQMAHQFESRPLLAEETCIVFTADGRWMATAHAHGRVALWAMDDWQMIAGLESPHAFPISQLAFGENGARLHCATLSGVVCTWNLEQLAEELAQRGLGW